MTPQQKANELVKRMYAVHFKMHAVHFNSKQCALIAVDEILKVAFYATDEMYNYYLEVKQEIEKL